jgi:hypothetical protein
MHALWKPYSLKSKAVPEIVKGKLQHVTKIVGMKCVSMMEAMT